jgi:hypothetical protein
MINRLIDFILFALVFFENKQSILSISTQQGCSFISIKTTQALLSGKISGIKVFENIFLFCQENMNKHNINLL